MSLTRGKLFELLSYKSNILKPNSEKLFLTGILSTLDAILKKPMNEILLDMPISDDVKEALTGKENLFYDMLNLSKYLEYTKWDDVDKLIEKYNISLSNLFNCYSEAIEWTDKIMSF